MIRFHTFSNEPYQQPILGNDSEASGPLSDRLGALFTWSNSSTSTIKSRVGVSFISAEKACQFRDDEIPTWSLNDTVAAAVKEWNRDVFSKIRVPTDDSRNRTDLVLLYSSLYFMHLMPSDRTGENPLWESDEPSWDDFYTAWDIFRCTTTLYHIIQPAYYEGMIRALIDIWRSKATCLMAEAAIIMAWSKEAVTPTTSWLMRTCAVFEVKSTGKMDIWRWSKMLKFNRIQPSPCQRRP